MIWMDKRDLLSKTSQIDDARNALQEAFEAYERAIEIHPDFGEAWKGKGEMLKTEGDACNASISLYIAGKLGLNQQISFNHSLSSGPAQRTAHLPESSPPAHKQRSPEIYNATANNLTPSLRRRSASPSPLRRRLSPPAGLPRP